MENAFREKRGGLQKAGELSAHLRDSHDRGRHKPHPLRPLLDIPAHARLVLLDSCKGSGKTLIMLAMPKTAEKKIIIIPRRMLARNIYGRAVSAKFKSLNPEAQAALGEVGFYLDKSAGVDTLVVCVDSLPKLNFQEWAGAEVWLDESELLLQHIYTSPTLKANRRLVIAMLTAICKNASRVVCMSADLSHKTANYFQAVTGFKPFYIKNSAKSAGFDVSLDCTTDRNHGNAIAHLLDSLRNGQRAFVYCDSRRMVKTINEAVQGEFKDIETDETSIISQEIHADNANDEPVVILLSKISAGKVDIRYDMVAASPTLGTGVSIEEDLFDIVFGIFGCHSQTVPDMVQGLLRVRRLVPRYVSVYDVRRGERTDFEGVRAELLDKYQNTTKVLSHNFLEKALRRIKGVKESPQELNQVINDVEQSLARQKEEYSALNEVLHDLLQPEIDPQEGFGAKNPEVLDLLTWLIVERRVSLNNPVDILIGLLQTDGHRITHVTTDRADADKVSAVVKETKKDVRRQEIDEVANAVLITPEQFEELDKRKDHLKSEEKAQYKKFMLQELLGRSDEVIVGLNEDLNLIHTSVLFQVATGAEWEALNRDLRDSYKHPVVSDRNNYTQLWHLFQVLHLPELLVQGIKLSKGNPLTEEVAALCLKNKSKIKQLLGFTVSSGAVKKTPVKVLSELLKQVGLLLINKEIEVEGARLRVYGYDRTWHIMQDILEYRRTKYQDEKTQEAAEFRLREISDQIDQKIKQVRAAGMNGIEDTEGREELNNLFARKAGLHVVPPAPPSKPVETIVTKETKVFRVGTREGQIVHIDNDLSTCKHSGTIVNNLSTISDLDTLKTFLASQTAGEDNYRVCYQCAKDNGFDSQELNGRINHLNNVYRELQAVGANKAAEWFCYPESRPLVSRDKSMLVIDIEFDRNLLVDLQRLPKSDRSQLGKGLGVEKLVITNSRLQTRNEFELLVPVAA